MGEARLNRERGFTRNQETNFQPRSQEINHTWNKVLGRNFLPKNQEVNLHLKVPERTSSSGGIFQAKKPVTACNPASESILEILRIKICPYSAPVDCHPKHWLSSQPHQRIPSQSGLKTKASKACTWDPGWGVQGLMMNQILRGSTVIVRDKVILTSVKAVRNYSGLLQ